MPTLTDAQREHGLRLRKSGSKRLKEETERSRRDNDFVWREFDCLLEKYRGRWIAIHDAHVIASGNDPRRLLRRVLRTGKAPREELTLHFMTEPPPSLLL